MRREGVGRIRWAIAFAVATVGALEPAEAQEPGQVEHGRAIAEEADRRARGFGDFTAQLEMLLVDRGGRETLRELELYTLEVSPTEQRSLAYFQSPRDIRGTELLTVSFLEGEDEQWLYLPALRRAKRISSNGRSSPFVGSEFSYEDLAPMFPDRFDYAYVGEETLDGAPTHVIERYPRYQGTAYRRQRVWIDTDAYRVLRVDSWDLRDRLFKTLTLSGYAEYAGEQWRPAEAVMVNHLTDEETRLRWSDYRFETGLRERDLSRAALGRVR